MRSRAVKNFIFLDDLVLSIAEYFYESHSLFDNPLVHVHVKLHVYLVSLLIHCINMIFLIDELGEENCQEYKQHVHRAITSSGKKSKVFTTLRIL